MTRSLGATRRHVLKWGAGVASVMVAGALVPNFGITAALADDLGSGDVGVLNYAYALEQLEAAFYTQVLANPFSRMGPNDQVILSQLRDHEVAHRDFLRNALGRARIGDLEVDFSAVNFSSRRSVLDTAKTFEDLGVAAYNGAGQLLRSVDYLAAAGSIVSIEARHAAAIRDLIDPYSASAVGRGVVNRQGLDQALLPSQVLPEAAPFISTPVSANALP
jgi:hypothetical protein